jgi:hypothetical protein
VSQDTAAQTGGLGLPDLLRALPDVANLPATSSAIVASDSEDVVVSGDTESESGPLNIQDYLDATSEASRRTRAVHFAIVIASVLMLAALVNSFPHNWMRQRLSRFADQKHEYVNSILDDKEHPDPEHPGPERRGGEAPNPRFERYKAYYQNLARDYVDNSLVVRVPFFGIAFDVNDLGPIGGIGFIILLLTMRFCLSREVDNVRLAFRAAVALKQLDAFYQLLAMRQVFTVPPGTTIRRSKLLLLTPKFFVFLPLIVFFAVVANDWATVATGTQLSFGHTLVVFAMEVLLLPAIVLLTRGLIGRLRYIDSLWERMWKQVGSPRERSLIINFQERYARIVFGLRPTANKGLYEPELYYELYWRLQRDQYEAWRARRLDGYIFWYWMHMRQLEWCRNEVVGTISYQEGWRHAVKRLGLACTDFEKHMDSVFGEATQSC